MDDEKHETEDTKPGSLEHTDAKESLRQLWWTIGVTLIGLVLLAFFYL